VAYTFDNLFAADPSNPTNVAANASILLYDPADPTKAPVTITDPTGSPIPNPVTVNKNGFGPAMQHATLDRLAWEGGGFSNFITSYEGIKNEAVSARTAAQEAAATAAAAAVAPTDEQVDQALIRADLPSVVTEVVAANPSVTSAAASLAQTDAGLVRGTDTRLAQNVGTLAGYKELVVTTGGYVLSAVLDDGTSYNFFDTANPARTSDPMPVPGYRNIVFDKTKTYVLEADKDDGTKYFHKLSADVLEIPDTAITRLAAVASFGDSMTGDHGGTGTSVGAYLGTVLGLPAFDGGIPGQTSTEAAFRSGGVEMWGNINGGTIPSTGSVGVTVTVPTGTWKATLAWTFAVTALLEDGTKIPGALVKAADDTWTFQPTSLATPKAAPREVKFLSDQGAANAQRGIIFRGGRNNPAADIDTIVRDYKAVREWVYATQARPRFIALPLYNPSDAPAGSTLYNQYRDINAAIAKECGPDFYDLRRWFYRYGLSAAGITATTQDTADIAQDIVPTSLRYNSGADTTHLTVAGRIAEATQIANVIKSRGWFTS